MSETWLVVLAPEDDFPEDGDLERIPAVPVVTVAKALEHCPMLRREGLRFVGDLLEPFTLASSGVRYLLLEEVGHPATVAAIAECLARGVGPVTILSDDHQTRARVKGGMSAGDIAALLQETGPSVEPVARAISLDPPPFAPGQPEKRRLPPLKTALIIGGILGLLGIPSGIYRGARGLLGCDPPPKKEIVDPAVADTESAMVYARLFLQNKDRKPTAEGWIEVPATPSITSHLVIRNFDDKLYICDGWKNRIRCTRQGGAYRFHSFGPNGVDDRGRGDDIVQTFPVQ